MILSGKSIQRKKKKGPDCYQWFLWLSWLIFTSGWYRSLHWAALLFGAFCALSCISITHFRAEVFTLQLRNTELESPCHSEEHMFRGWDAELPLIPPFFLNTEIRNRASLKNPVSVSPSMFFPMWKKPASRVHDSVFLPSNAPLDPCFSCLLAFLVFYISVKLFQRREQSERPAPQKSSGRVSGI